MNTSTFVLLAASTLTAHIGWRRGARALALCAGGFALLLAWAVIREAHPLVVAGLVGVAAAVVWQRWGRSSAIVARWGDRSRRKSGVASWLDIARHRSGLAMRRRAGVLRPSLRTSGIAARIRQLRSLPVTEVAVRLCRTGRVWVWSAVEEVVLVFGGPRKGKTQWLAGQILDAPGAVIATSTRLDLLDQIGPLRAAMGPMFVFNPVGLGARTSTITFDPLIGCTDPVTAMERAADMIGGGRNLAGSSGDREFWDEQGRRILAALMHAAALGDLTMDTVAAWLAELDDAQQEITRLLRDHSPEPVFVTSITQFIETNDRTRTSVTATIAPALGWLTHGPARAAALPATEGGHPFDVGELLDTRALVFIVGGEEAQVTPLVCALTGYIAREARRLAAFQPGGRLDPPLALRLDECALICPVPLHQWSADMGGRGVNIVACFQSRAQLIDRYGDAKAATTINNSGGRVLYGGTADRDDLEYWSALAGERDERVATRDARGRVISWTLRRVPVLPVAQLATLAPGRVVGVHQRHAAGPGRCRAGLPPPRRARPPQPQRPDRPRPRHPRPLAGRGPGMGVGDRRARHHLGSGRDPRGGRRDRGRVRAVRPVVRGPVARPAPPPGRHREAGPVHPAHARAAAAHRHHGRHHPGHRGTPPDARDHLRDPPAAGRGEPGRAGRRASRGGAGMSLTMGDLFCGAGGSTQGASLVDGVEIRYAANHWSQAVATHAENFPHVVHDLADISQVDPRRTPRTDILWASPECTNHSVAKGRRRADVQPDLFGETLPDEAAERSRATMWDVPRFAEHHRYRVVIVENVVDAARWIMFPAWLQAMELLGYRHRIVWLNSMHAPAVAAPAAPQSRDRMYVVFWRNGQPTPQLDIRPPAWCAECGVQVAAVQWWKRGDRAQWGRYRAQYLYRCPRSECRHAIVEPYAQPAAAAIDWSLRGQRIGDRDRPLSVKTMARIAAGLSRYARPLTFEARGNTFVRHGADGRPVYARAWPVDRPTATLTGSETRALVVPYYGTGRAHPVDEALHTVPARERFGLAFIAELRGGHSVARPVEHPLATVTASGNHHMLVRHNSSTGAGGEMSTPVTEPARTLTTTGHQSIVGWPHTAPAVEDCTFRMLEPREIQAAMAFHPEYRVLGTRREQVRQLGNGVTPPAAEFLLRAVVASLNGTSAPVVSPVIEPNHTEGELAARHRTQHGTQHRTPALSSASGATGRRTDQHE